jgi:predicted Zn-dependent protease
MIDRRRLKWRAPRRGALGSAAMPVDPDVIAALEAVVDREPANLALALHLGELLLDAGRPADALAQSRRVLERAPADPSALELERRAAAAARRGGGLRLL